MIDPNLAKLLHSLRLNLSYLAKIVALILVVQFCFLAGAAISLYLSPVASSAQVFSAAMLGLGFLLSAVSIHLLFEMKRNDLILPSE